MEIRVYKLVEKKIPTSYKYVTSWDNKILT